MPPGSVVLGGERQGIKVEGFEFGNSPASYSPEVCRGKTVVITTTNGTRGILASQEADRVLIGSFSNLGATVAAISAAKKPIHVVCSGTDGLVSFEDTLLAGAIVAAVKSIASPANDSALIALWTWLDAKTRMEDEAGDLASFLALGRGGRRVREIGQGEDVKDVARVDQWPLVAELRREPLRIVRVD
jgi:2-phosphosulfolactate phosphatase